MLLCLFSTPAVEGQTTNSTANSTAPLQIALDQFIDLATNATGDLADSLNGIVGNLTNLIAQRNGTNNMTQQDAIQGVVDSVLDLQGVLLTSPSGLSDATRATLTGLINVVNGFLANVQRLGAVDGINQLTGGIGGGIVGPVLSSVGGILGGLLGR